MNEYQILIVDDDPKQLVIRIILNKMPGKYFKLFWIIIYN